MEANGGYGGFTVSQWSTWFPHSTLCIRANSTKAAAQIIESIWRKWDIVADRPLPEGVERIWNKHSKKSDVVWKRGGISYYIPMSNPSV